MMRISKHAAAPGQNKIDFDEVEMVLADTNGKTEVINKAILDDCTILGAEDHLVWTRS